PSVQPPDGDNQLYYEFEVNAGNAWWDLLLDGGPALMSWESVSPSEPTQLTGPSGWQPVRRGVWVDGKLNDPGTPSRGWGVELAFPWSLLRQAAGRPCPPQPGDQWRVNFSRVQWRVEWDEGAGAYRKQPAEQQEDNWVWSPQWAIAMHQPETWGYLQFGPAPPAAPADPPGSAAAPSGSAGQQVSAALGPWADGFRPDPCWPLRDWLMEVYYRQKARVEGADDPGYAADLAALGLAPPPPGVAQCVLLAATEASFLAAGQLPVGPGGSMLRLSVNEEGRLRAIRPQRQAAGPVDGRQSLVPVP
ncbi:hypothetical protein V8C86DRAFT_2966537, partial [Haematococcus lacustris]